MVYNRLNDWGEERELPAPPKEDFKSWVLKQQPSLTNGGQKTKKKIDEV